MARDFSLRGQPNGLLLWVCFFLGCLAAGSLKNVLHASDLTDDPQMNVTSRPFGTTPKDDVVQAYTLSNRQGMTATVISYGATLVSLEVPDRNGKADQVVLGYDNLRDYIDDVSYFGSTVGRYANRVAEGRFTLQGKEHKLAKNDPPNHLHGGDFGFSKKIWTAVPLKDHDKVAVRFTYTSPAGEEGYPGQLQASVTYTLDDENQLHIDYQATTDQTTHCNLTNHTYWNLAGHDAGSVLDHRLTLYCDHYLPTDEGLIPTGEIVSVVNTPYDFRGGKAIGSQIDNQAGLYDICLAADRSREGLLPVAKVVEPTSGRVLEILSTEPGVQFYTGNHLDNVTGTGGASYQKHQGFCLETQRYPDTPNKPDFPTSVLHPGKSYRSVTLHKFSTQ